MKKRLFAVILSVLMIFSLFSVVAFAEAETLHEDFDDIDMGTIRTKELYLAVPDEYELEVWTEGEHLTYSNYDSDYIYVVCQKNDCATEGINALTQEEATKICMEYYDEINSAGFLGNEKSNFEVSTAQKQKYNGVTGYGLSGVISYEAYDSEEPYYYALEAYLFATKESIYVIIFEDNTEIFREQEDVKSTLDTIAVNGTYFDGDKTTLDRDFANAPDFKSAVELTYGEAYSDYDGYEDMYLYSIVGTIILIIFIVLIIAAFVALCVMNYMKSKKIQAYERMYGPLNYVTTPVYVPVQTPPVGQPMPQAETVPAPPPMPQADRAAPAPQPQPPVNVQDDNPQATTDTSVDINNQE